MTLAIAINGAAGRMGQALVRAVGEHLDCHLAAALVRPQSVDIGKDAGAVAGCGELGTALSADFSQLDAAQVLVDFSMPDATLAVLAACRARGMAMVVATTGLAPAQQRQVADAAGEIPILVAPNVSIGANLCMQLSHMAARVLGETVDVEVIEAHHRHKVDAPSGTALRLGDTIAKAWGRELKDCAVYGRHGMIGERPAGSIGFAVVRAGDIAGEHTVLFAGSGECLEITHRAASRALFAAGALRAAQWLTGRPAGLYNMQQVLGFDT